MSRAALCALALAGCNQVFGLDPIVRIDAGVDSDMLVPENGHVMLTRTRVAVAGPGVGVPTDDSSPIMDARIRAGVVTGELFDLSRDPDDLSQYIVPSRVLEEPSRLEVTLADGSPPVEVEWPVDAKDVRLVVPEIGHAAGDELTPNEQWSVTFSGGPAGFQQIAVISTGAWLSWQGGPASNPVNVLWADAAAYGDERWRPSDVRGDYLVALELATPSSCERQPIAIGAIPPPPLGQVEAVTAARITATTTITATWDVINDFAFSGLVLGDLASSGDPEVTFVYGFAPRPDLVTRAWRIGPRTPMLMETRAVLPLLECNPETMGQPSFTPIVELEDRYGDVSYGRMRWRRQIRLPDNTTTIADSGFEIVAPVSGEGLAPRTTVLGRGVAFPVTDPESVDLAMRRVIELCTNGTCVPLTTDNVQIGRFSDTKVRFILEEGKQIDFWSVTLVRVLPSGLVPLRIFLTETALPPLPPPPPPIDAPPEPPPTKYEASFDLSDGVKYPAGQYLFIIRGHLGWPNARFGDFQNHRLPYQISTTSTHYFTLP